MSNRDKDILKGYFYDYGESLIERFVRQQLSTFFGKDVGLNFCQAVNKSLTTVQFAFEEPMLVDTCTALPTSPNTPDLVPLSDELLDDTDILTPGSTGFRGLKRQSECVGDSTCATSTLNVESVDLVVCTTPTVDTESIRLYLQNRIIQKTSSHKHIVKKIMNIESYKDNAVIQDIKDCIFENRDSLVILYEVGQATFAFQLKPREFQLVVFAPLLYDFQPFGPTAVSLHRAFLNRFRMEWKDIKWRISRRKSGKIPNDSPEELWREADNCGLYSAIFVENVMGCKKGYRDIESAESIQNIRTKYLSSNRLIILFLNKYKSSGFKKSISMFKQYIP